MHLRAASMAIVVCGLMIGTLAAQYAQQGHNHAHDGAQSSAPASHQHAQNAPADERRRFSLWGALTGSGSDRNNNNHNNNNRNHNRQPPRSNSGGLGSWLPFGSQPEPTHRPPAYSGNRNHASAQQGQGQQPRTPVSQFGPPVGGYSRRPANPPQQNQSAHNHTAPENTHNHQAPQHNHAAQARPDPNLADAFSSPPTRQPLTGHSAPHGAPHGAPHSAPSSATTEDQGHAGHDHGSHNHAAPIYSQANSGTQHVAQAPQQHQQQQRPRSRGLMSPVLDLFGNRHEAPEIPRHQPRAGTAFNNQRRPQQQHQHEERSDSRTSLLPEMILNGRPGPMPMLPQTGSTVQDEPHMVGLPETADQQPTPAERRSLANAPATTPQHNAQQHNAQHTPQRRQLADAAVQPQPAERAPAQTDPRSMASSEVGSPRLGPSDAELGITPPPAADPEPKFATAEANSDVPSNSILADQPLVRVKKPQQQNNAVLKSMADRLQQQRQAEVTPPKTYDDWLNRGKALALEQNFVDAIQAYTRAIELDPYGLEAYGNRGLAYRQREMYREAVYDFNIVLRLKPEMSKAYYDRAETYRMAGKLEKAARDYEESIRLQPDFALAHAQYGAMLMRNGEYADAVEILDAAIALDESDELSVYDRGLAFALKGDFQSAMSDFEDVAPANKDDSRWHDLLTRLRRPGEPVTTVEIPSTIRPAPEALADAAPAQPAGPPDDLSADPFFSGMGESTPKVATKRTSPSYGIAPREPKPLVADAEAVGPRTPVAASQPKPSGASPERSPIASQPLQTQPKQTQPTPAQPEKNSIANDWGRGTTSPQPAEVATPPAEPKDKPLRIVLGGGSTKLDDDDDRTFVRVAEPKPNSADKQNRVTSAPATNSPTNNTPVAQTPKLAAPVVQSTPAQDSTLDESQGDTGLVLHDADSLWAATQRNRAASRAARRGDGSFLKVITRDQSAMDPAEESDPFAVIASPRTSVGVGRTIRPVEPENKQPANQVVAVPNSDSVTSPGAMLEFDGVQLPDPSSLTTLAETDAAIEKYNEAILRRPRFAPYYVARAQLWLMQERRTAALTDLRQAVRLDGGLAEAIAAKEKLEAEIADDLDRQKQMLRTADGGAGGWGRGPRR